MMAEMKAKLEASERVRVETETKLELSERQNEELSRTNEELKIRTEVEPRVEEKTETRDPAVRRRRVALEPVELRPTMEATAQGDGTFNKQVTEAANIDGRVESHGKRVSESQMQELKLEIERLAKSEVEAERTRARNLETVVRILESTESSQVREKAHSYIAKRIADGTLEAREGEAGIGKGSVSRGVALGIVVSAVLAYYANSQKALAGEPEFEERATVGSR